MYSVRVDRGCQSSPCSLRDADSACTPGPGASSGSSSGELESRRVRSTSIGRSLTFLEWERGGRFGVGRSARKLSFGDGGMYVSGGWLDVVDGRWSVGKVKGSLER